MQVAGSAADGSRPIARRAHKKSKGGCRTCKVRKIKCDEVRPVCGKCAIRFLNLLACDFDGHDRVFDPRVPLDAARSEAGPSRDPVRRGLDRPDLVGRDAEILRMPPTIAAGRIDPFEARPPSQQPAPSIDALSGHYLGHFAYRSFPLYANQSLIGAWWTFIREDDVLFHTILLVSAVDRDRLQGLEDSIHTRGLFGDCMRLLGSRLDDPITRTNDHTVACVAALAGLELGRGNMRALQGHLNGLQQLANMRGGLEAIRTSNEMVGNLAFWVGMVAMNGPSFLPLTYGDEVEAENNDDDEPAWLLDPATATLLTHDGGEAELTQFGVDIITANLLHRAQRLSKLYAANIALEAPRSAFTALSSLCSVLERMLRLSRSTTIHDHDSPIPGLSQSCRLAGCLHLFTPQAGYFPDPTTLQHGLVVELRIALTQTIRATGTNSSTLLLWLLAVGGIAAHEMPAERAWFVNWLVLVVGDLDIGSWDEMRSHLVMLAFHDNFCDVSFHALWEEVRAKQDALLTLR